MTGSDRQQLAVMSEKAKAAMGMEALEVLADRGYFSGEEILACEAIGVTPYVPKPQTSGAKADGRFGKQDFVYLPQEDVYRCPAGQKLSHRMTTVERGLVLHRYWDRASCQACHLKPQCTPSPMRRITRWEHEDVVEAMQRRMDLAPHAKQAAVARPEKDVAVPDGDNSSPVASAHSRPAVSAGGRAKAAKRQQSIESRYLAPAISPEDGRRALPTSARTVLSSNQFPPARPGSSEPMGGGATPWTCWRKSDRECSAPGRCASPERAARPSLSPAAHLTRPRARLSTSSSRRGG